MMDPKKLQSGTHVFVVDRGICLVFNGHVPHQGTDNLGMIVSTANKASFPFTNFRRDFQVIQNALGLPDTPKAFGFSWDTPTKVRHATEAEITASALEGNVIAANVKKTNELQEWWEGL